MQDNSSLTADDIWVNLHRSWRNHVLSWFNNFVLL